jgi:anionic cell wall polymer biosynthesis LytR-Cps2A-Psr (LCP) family protein
MEDSGYTESQNNPANPEEPEKPEKKSRSVFLWGAIILLLICLLGGGGSYFAWKRLTQPTPLVDVGEEAAETAAPDLQGTAQPAVCGRSDQQIILLLAYDTMLEYPYGSDGVRLLKVDYANHRIELLALPSRLWVVAPQQVQPTLQAASLGELYQYGLNQGGMDVKEARTAAAQLVAQALFDNFGLVSNNFAVLETETFAQIVDSLGGIDITLPASTTLNGQVYNAGKQHWDGATALEFVRVLPAEQDDWDRFARQNLVLSAIKASAQASSGLTQIPDLLVQFGSGLTTDLSVTDMTDISCLSRQVPADQVQVESLPAELVTPGPGIYLMPDYEAMTAYLQEWMFGR